MRRQDCLTVACQDEIPRYYLDSTCKITLMELKVICLKYCCYEIYRVNLLMCLCFDSARSLNSSEVDQAIPLLYYFDFEFVNSILLQRFQIQFLNLFVNQKTDNSKYHPLKNQINDYRSRYLTVHQRTGSIHPRKCHQCITLQLFWILSSYQILLCHPSFLLGQICSCQPFKHAPWSKIKFIYFHLFFVPPIIVQYVTT